MKIIKAADRHFSDFGWLQTYWLFSFDTYFDPANTHFGRLRVFNDDIVAAGKGFPMHPHQEMEIITIVHDGELSHEDSTGQRGVIKPGEIQIMTAGRGINHSEYNHGRRDVSFYQIWLLPNQPSLDPLYRQKDLSGESRRNKLVCIAGGFDPADDIMSLSADAALSLADLDPGTTVEHRLEKDHGAFIYLTSGKVTVNDTVLESRDQARIDNLLDLQITAQEQSSLILIETVM
jgi:hypothetical protein